MNNREHMRKEGNGHGWDGVGASAVEVSARDDGMRRCYSCGARVNVGIRGARSTRGGPCGGIDKQEHGFTCECRGGCSCKHIDETDHQHARKGDPEHAGGHEKQLQNNELLEYRPTEQLEKTYTGSPIKPLSRIYSGKLKRDLIKGTEYKVTYKNNVNVGTMTATISYKGKFSSYGTKVYQIKIARANVDACTVSAVAQQFYTGKAIKPVPTLKLNDKKLAKGTDFTVSYYKSASGKVQSEATPKAVGTYKVKIVGKGNFTGSRWSNEFAVVKRSPELSWLSAPAGGALYVGQAFDSKAVVAKGGGKVAYSTSDAQVAWVGASGRIVAAAPGKAIITASVPASGIYGSQVISLSLTVKATTSHFGFYQYGKWQADNYLWDDLRVGSAIVSGNLRDYVRTDSPAEITYFSSTPEVFSVDAQGNYRAMRPGYARVCIAQRSNEHYPASHIFINVAVKTPEGRDVQNWEWQACDATASAAWAALGASAALGQGSLPFDTMIGAVFGADAGSALYGLPQLNSVLTSFVQSHSFRVANINTAKASAKIAMKYGLEVGAVGVCAVGSIVYAYHLSENTDHTWRFEHEENYRESAEALMREESWHRENDWLEVYRIGQLEGYMGTQSIRER